MSLDTPAENTVSEEELTFKINGLTKAARPAAQAFYHIGYRDNPQDFYGKAQQGFCVRNVKVVM